MAISAKAHGKHARAIASATATFAKKFVPAPPRPGETCMPFSPRRIHSATTLACDIVEKDDAPFASSIVPLPASLFASL
jgi:hypothetical protein